LRHPIFHLAAVNGRLTLIMPPRLFQAFHIATIVLSCLAATVAVAKEPAADTKDAAVRKRPAGFDRVYQLRKKENAKHIDPPFIPEREAFLLFRGVISEDNVKHLPQWNAEFHWDGAQADFWSLSAGEGTLGSALALAGIERPDVDGDQKLLWKTLPGDWVVRKDAKPEAILEDVLPIVRKALGSKIHVEKVKAPRQVIVVRGKYKFAPLADAPDKKAVHLPSRLFISNEPARKATLREFLNERMAAQVNRRFVLETPDADKRLAYQVHPSLNEYEGQALVERVIADLALQTSLTFDLETREIDIWQVWDGDKRPSLSPVPEPTGL
jgi:hypothetical protein